MSDFIKAPEIIYLQWTGSEFDEDNTWCCDQINDDDIEYIQNVIAASHLELLRLCIVNTEYCPICRYILLEGDGPHAADCELVKVLGDD